MLQTGNMNPVDSAGYLFKSLQIKRTAELNLTKTTGYKISAQNQTIIQSHNSSKIYFGVQEKRFLFRLDSL